MTLNEHSLLLVIKRTSIIVRFKYIATYCGYCSSGSGSPSLVLMFAV